MRLLSWLLWAAAALVPVITSEERNLARPKRESSEKKIVCYYTNWSVYRPGTAKFSPQNINPYLCTHLIYAFGGLSKDNALKPFDKYQDIEQGGYAKFNGLKTYNKNLKTMLAIGGWNEGSARFSPLVADAERRKELVKNTVKFLRQNHFDGLDLDWEYPSFRDGGKPRDRDNYATLVQEFREEFERESEKTGRSRLLLTMAVPAGIEYIDKGYDVPKLNKYLDWMNILSYDYHSAFEPAINHHSPLFSMEEDDEYNFDAQLNIDYTVQHYIKLGADRNKLVLGIPTYGRSYTLFNPDATEIGSPADGPGEQGEATREKGYLAYYEICERVKSGGWELENPNPEAMGPYAYKGNQWVGYDDEDIVRAKAKYVNDNDLGGIMFWSIDNDDFRGKCHGKPYPLIEAAKEALLANANELVPTTSRSSKSNSKKQEEESNSKSKTRKSRLRTKSSTTTEASKSKSSARTTTTPQPPTTPDPGSDFVCKDEGFFPHPRDCKKYFWCLDSGPSSLGIVAHQFTCPSGLVFNKISDSCDYARNVICKTKSEASTTTTTTTTSTTTSRTTTARSRLVITASPPRHTTTTTTTTTEQPYEDEEESEEDEEDPGTIKELINLIKKLGGVEQLEKQLNLQNSDDKIKPSLYSKVLQGRTGNRYRGINEEPSTPKYVSVFRNRPVGPQSPSTEEISTGTRGQEKPRYVTIQRNRPTKKPTKVEETEEEEEEEEEQEQPKKETPRPFRRRPNTDPTTEREYTVLRRSRPPKDEEEVSTSKYKNIVRVRSTTEAAADKDEEDVSEISEEEEEVEEEEEKEVEPGQKLKKYSAIIRDNKKVESDEEEPKVSGPQGPQYHGGVQSSSTTDHTTEERDNVNNVYTITSPRYVEIRRPQLTTTETFVNDVNSVNSSPESVRETTESETNNESEENKSEERETNGFQRRFTTEIVRRPTRPSTRLTTTSERTTASSAEPKETESIRFRGRFRSNPTTEPITTVEVKPNNRYKILNRNNPEKSVVVDENESNQLPKRERVTRTTTTTTETTSSPGVPRRFQFAPRTKPTILSPKPHETTTEPFTITVPDLPNPTFTENSFSSDPSSYPSATLEPSTAIAPSVVDSTFSDAPENNVILTTFPQKRFPSTRHSNPTTSTQTSVVTSITESSFTERKRISIPKKSRFKSELGLRFAKTTTTTEEPSETLRPSLRSTGYKTIIRSTTPNTETTKEPRRRFKLKSTTTTTTTEPSIPEKKYVPKKTRNFKKITSTELPEVTSSTTESRARFQPRNRPRQADFSQSEPSNSLFSRFGNARRKKIVSKNKEEDLDVDQTGGFFGSEAGTDNKYILGGAVKQKSDKDYLNADILLITVPTVEEEEAEKSSDNSEDELVNLLDLVKNNGPSVPSNNKTDPKESFRNKFITNNPNLRNLRTRTRTSTPNPREPNSSILNTTQTVKSPREGIANNFFTANPNLSNNFRSLRTRTQQARNNNVDKETVEQRTQADIKEPVKSNAQSPRISNFRFSSNKPQESDDTEKVEGRQSPTGFGARDSNRNNLRGLRTRTQQDNEIYKEEQLQEKPVENNLETQNFRKLKTRTGRPVVTTESSSGSTLESNFPNKNFRNPRTRGRQFTNVVEGTVPTVASPLPVRSTKEPTTSYSSNSSQRSFRTSRNRNDGKNSDDSSVSSTFTIDNVKEPIIDNFIVTKSEGSFSSTKGTQTESRGTHETGSTVSLTADTTESSTFGAKLGSTQISTLGLTGYVYSSTGSTASSTASPTTGSNILTGSTQESSRSTSTTSGPTQKGLRTVVIRSRTKQKPTEPTSGSIPLEEEDARKQVGNATLTNQNFRNFRTRAKQNTTNKSSTADDSQDSISNNVTPSNLNQSNLKLLRTRARGRENIPDSATQASETSSLNEISENSINERPLSGKDRRRLTLRTRPSQSTSETNEKEDESDNNTSEAPPSPKVTSSGRGTQEYFTNLRNKARSTTQPTTTSDRAERRRPLLDRRRIRPTTSTSKPEVYTEISSSTSKSTTYLRRRIRPTTSTTTTTTTTTTTEEPYVEQQDSRLEESKTLDETPDIQDLADPAVVAIHNLATVSPGPIGSIGTSSLKVYPETPATYTVHVTPSDIASFSTPARIATVTPGTVSARPTTILTLKPYTIPVITKDYKQTPIAYRTPSPFRVATEEPYSPRSEILIQARRQETTQKTKPTVAIAATSQTTPRSRRLKPYSKLPKQEAVQSVSSPDPSLDYEYYDDDEDPLANIPPSALKVKVHSDGYIECLDRGNFPHPFSCKKFISCAKMENNELLGWEYTCPKHLSFDPVGGICNWSAGLGCQH